MKRVFLPVLGFLVWALWISQSVALENVKKGLVLYPPSLEDLAVGVTNLLGHFGEYHFYMVSCDQETPPKLIQEIRDAQAVFALGAKGAALPPGDVRTTLLHRKGCTCFVGNHPWLGMTTFSMEATYAEYKDKKHWMGDYRFYPKEEADPTSIYAFIEGEGGKVFPFIFKENDKRFYVLGIPLFDAGGFIFADALHEILGVRHEPRRLAMIRLEDINPSYRGKRLEKFREATQYLYNEGIPFSMAVYPIFRVQDSQKAIRIMDNPPFLEALKEAVAQGGTLIFHGASHQYRQTSGEGSEFWDVKLDRPIPHEKEYFHQRMRYGLWLFKQVGLFPLLFEAPHYNLSLALQRELLQYYDTIAGELMLNNRSYKLTQSLPYFIHRNAMGLKVIPEQLGYIEDNHRTLSLLEIENKLNLLDSIVRDPFACFFYHPYVAGSEYLKKLVPFLLDRGYSFVDLQEYTKGLRYDPQPVKDLWPVAVTKGKRRFITWGVLGAAILAALIFSRIYIIQRRKRRKDLFHQS